VKAALDHLAKARGTATPLPAPECIEPLVVLRDAVDRQLVLAVREAIEAGCSWAQVAEQLGVSRQSAHERYAPRILALAEGAAGRA
jgi:hypothetical protein